LIYNKLIKGLFLFY